MPFTQETIAAIATPIGQAGIGIVRISGPRSFSIAKSIFAPKNPSNKTFISHRLYLGYVRDPATGETVDEALISFMAAPHSYTKEDVVEINAHSGYVLLSKILEIVLAQGARMAKPGEFTQRAFLNGRIDLTQAEAVIDLMNARSERGLMLAARQIQGSIKHQAENLREKALEILAHAEAAIDFPEEDIEHIFQGNGPQKIQEELIEPITHLMKSHAGRIWVDGVKTVILGRVNAGKSSLLNRLLDEPRAIVTDTPGTTRDVIESSLNIQGIPLRLMDTAGLRKAENTAEQLGIRLTRQKAAEADLLLVVVDQSRPLDADDLEILTRCRAEKTMVILNKTDLLPAPLKAADEKLLKKFMTFRISALTGSGMNNLKQGIRDFIVAGSEIDLSASQVTVNLRQKEALKAARDYFMKARETAEAQLPMEIVALELRSGLDALGDITGHTTNEDVLDGIFSRFCLGK